jgi:hypothetical protein
MDTKDFTSKLTAAQIDNWKKLVEYISEADFGYDHGQYDTDVHDRTGYRCALSFAAMANLFDRTSDTGLGYDDYNYGMVIDEFGDSIEEAFGEGSCDVVFHGYSDFDKFLHRAIDNDTFDNSSVQAAEHLAKFLGLENLTTSDEIYVTVHWKSNQKDRFESLEALKSYFSLNPHRKKGYRKVTVTKMVPRTVYDEVVETIEV